MQENNAWRTSSPGPLSDVEFSEKVELVGVDSGGVLNSRSVSMGLWAISKLVLLVTGILALL